MSHQGRKICRPLAKNIRSLEIINESSRTENIRSSDWKYTVPRNRKWVIKDRKYKVPPLKIYGPFAENIRSQEAVNESPRTDNIQSSRWKYTVPKNHKLFIYDWNCAENPRSSRWKYTVPKNHIWVIIDSSISGKYTVLSLKIYGPKSHIWVIIDSSIGGKYTVIPLKIYGPQESYESSLTHL